jgi:hypothetical protein
MWRMTKAAAIFLVGATPRAVLRPSTSYVRQAQVCVDVGSIEKRTMLLLDIFATLAQEGCRKRPSAAPGSWV